MQDKLEKDLMRAIKSARLSSESVGNEETLLRMESIMHALEALQSVDVNDVLPLYLPTEDMLKEMSEMRSDYACNHIAPEAVTKHAPDAQKNLFLLPKMVD